jgi:hypothetical protein
VKARLAGGASATTINRSLEVVRRILHRAAALTAIRRSSLPRSDAAADHHVARTRACPTPSPGKNRRRSSADYLRTSRAWRSLR